MTDYYQTAGIKVFPKTGKAVLDGKPVNIRPKTFELLLMLITSEETVSKQSILNTIWDDVVVDEQVIFQSIKELRKLFAGRDVIKTFPRKGYAWIAEVEFYSKTEESLLASLTSSHEKKVPLSFAFKATCTSVFVITCTLILFFLLPKERSITGSVVVLPIQNNIEDSHHQWVRYGVMDQLIQRLSSSEKVGILNTDYVMEVMKRADMPSTSYGREHIEQIFNVSGTTLVVDVMLTGNSGDYQLVYTLHQPTNIEKGAILGDQLGLAIDELASVINRKLGRSTDTKSSGYESAFANEILAEAIALKHQGNKEGAMQLLKAMLVTELNSLTAQRLVVEIALDNQDSETVDKVLSNAIPMAIQMENHKELIRLQFFAAIQAVRQGDVALSQQLIAQVQTRAEAINDWLYLAYASEFTGVLYQNLKKFEQAEASFNQALEYHDVLQCPLGRSKGFMFLSELAEVQGDVEAAKVHVEHALVITQQRGLKSYLPEVEDRLYKLVNNPL